MELFQKESCDGFSRMDQECVKSKYTSYSSGGDMKLSLLKHVLSQRYEDQQRKKC